ncbi:type I pantothenate kinase [Xylocopilactobacillus apicola]|uniref:Pantothenate kinase n=1 Tax=Xylocopilactobacillus apicola TaxID=2932184 RepID=A0AAU9DLZ9_9LACO|nr:type I pantothenate kinase [Xylocopilactobacillus apicola]BDR57912.1 pantothenate kinase [Xylocopilactobacillus apicola]
MSHNDAFSYHELNLKAVSQMKNLQGRVNPAFLKDDVVEELANQSEMFGLLYLIGLKHSLKLTEDRSFDNYFKGPFFKRRTPFLIGITGAVSVGKSTFAKDLADKLHEMNPNQRAEIVSSDDFLFPNAELVQKNLMDKKGFPESFDNEALWNFLVNAASFNESQDIPIYDHLTYDILDRKRRVRSADFLIVEGINVLQTNPLNGQAFSEMMDLTIYLEAAHESIINWFLNRFNDLLDHAEPGGYFEKYAQMQREESNQLAKDTYAAINQPNFENFIEPTRNRANLIVQFDDDHEITRILMRDY